jgi:hypothetical protein
MMSAHSVLDGVQAVGAGQVWHGVVEGMQTG